MPTHKEEEEHYIATLNELEATQERITSYQVLMRDLPEIYEQKFNQRLKAIVDRNQQLINERHKLLHQLQRSRPTDAEPLGRANPLPVASTAKSHLEPPPQRWRHQGLGLVALALLGGIFGIQLRRQIPPAPSSPSHPPQPISGAWSPSPAAFGMGPGAVALAPIEWTPFDMATFQDYVHA